MAPKRGELLVERGRLTAGQIEEALRVQRIFGGPLGAHLLQLGFVDEETLAEALGELHGVPAATRADLSAIDEELLRLLPPGFARSHRAVPFRREGGRLFLALSNPADTLALSEAERRSELEIVPHVVPEALMREVLARIEQRRSESSSTGGPLPIDGPRLAAASSRDDVLDALFSGCGTLLGWLGLFLVNGPSVLLWAARGPAGARTGASLRLASSAFLRRAVSSADAVTGVPDDGDPLLPLLGPPERAPLFAVSIRFRGDVVALVIGPAESGRAPRSIVEMADLASLALEAVAIRRRILERVARTPPA